MHETHVVWLELEYDPHEKDVTIAFKVTGGRVVENVEAISLKMTPLSSQEREIFRRVSQDTVASTAVMWVVIFTTTGASL